MKVDFLKYDFSLKIIVVTILKKVIECDQFFNFMRLEIG